MIARRVGCAAGGALLALTLAFVGLVALLACTGGETRPREPREIGRRSNPVDGLRAGWVDVEEWR